MQKITPFLWFDKQAEEAANFYVSIFKNSRTDTIRRYGDAGPGAKDSVMTVAFQLDGQEFVTLNGGPHFTFSPATSFVVNCETQAEVDEFWEKLGAGGQLQQCGWLTDKYGVTWQIVPTALKKMMANKDHDRVARVLQALMPMKKLEIKALKKAFNQK